MEKPHRRSDMPNQPRNVDDASFRPPRWATWLLITFGDPHTGEEVQGDLLELYAHWVRTLGKRRADWRYSLSAFKLMRPLAKPKHVPEYTTTFFLSPDMIRNYVKVAFRNLIKNKVYSAINIGGLAVGMACCLLITLYVYDELNYDRFNTNFNHIYRVVERQKQPEGIVDVAVTPGPLAPTLLKDFPEVSRAVRVGRWQGLLSQGQQSVESDQMLIIDPSFFDLFSYPLLQGNINSLFKGPDEVIFSEKMAERFFGINWRQQHILGKSFRFNNERTLMLVGVAQNPPVQSHIQFDVLLPFKWLEHYDEWSNKWNSNNYHTYIQLKPDASGETANPAIFGEKIRHQIKRYNPENDPALLLQPLSDIYLHSKFAFQTDFGGKRSDIAYIRIFVIVGLIVLLIAVINFINLATARASQRAKEVGVRKSIGARRSSLLTQFLGESLFMTGLAVFVSIFLADLLLPLFNNLADKSLQIPYHLPAFWLVMIALTGTVSLLAGLYPAFILSAFRPVTVLKAGVSGAFSIIKTGRSFRQSLVIGQFVLSIGLAICTVIIYRQLIYLQTTKLGFNKSQLLYVRLKGELKGKAMQFKDEVDQLPGVAKASVATGNLVDMNNSSNVEWEGQTPKDEFLITQMNVDADFIKTTGMSLTAGRNFSTQITSDTLSTFGAYLINETAAKRMGWTPTKAVGKRVKFWGTEGTVIGVVKDFHFRPLRTAIEPFILRFRPKEMYFTVLVKTKPDRIASTINDITRLYKRTAPAYPITYGFVDQDLDLQYRSEQRIGGIIGYFTILTILVSCLGLFGLTAYTAEVRTKEIGIRKVLGASVASIVALLSKDFLRLVAIAVVIASPIAWYAMHRWLQDFAYRVDIAWWVFALTGLLMVVIALLTVSFQSIKAALINPVNSLRSE